jgi:ABC-type glycerol-3-phosphate transport system substrate-binding protein
VRVRRLMLLRVVVLVGLVGLSGCGTGADRAQVRAVTVRFFSAIGAHRGADACMQLSPSLRKTVTQQESAAGCAEAVGKVKARGSAIEVVHVYATSARADLAGGASVFLSAMRDGWRIDALGCRPRSSGPFDCEAQG